MLTPIKQIIILFFFFIPHHSVASLITNGDFDSGLLNWHALGSVSINSNAVQISTEVGYTPFNRSAILQGDDGTFSFANAIQLTNDIKWLSFDAKVDSVDDFLETDFSAFNDYLVVSLFDEMDFTGAKDLFFYSEIDFVLMDTWLTFELDVSSLSGRTVALAFEVFDENNKSNSTFHIDNIQFSDKSRLMSVSEPKSPFVIILAVLYGVYIYRRHFKLPVYNE